MFLAIDRSGTATNNNIYMPANVVSPGRSTTDVMFVSSTDAGQTFSTPRRINDDPVNPNKWHWFGTLSVARKGRIDSVWYDTRNAAKNTDSMLFYSWSTDGGVTWAANVAISNASDPFEGETTSGFDDPRHLLEGSIFIEHHPKRVDAHGRVHRTREARLSEAADSEPGLSRWQQSAPVRRSVYVMASGKISMPNRSHPVSRATHSPGPPRPQPTSSGCGGAADVQHVDEAAKVGFGDEFEWLGFLWIVVRVRIAPDLCEQFTRVGSGEKIVVSVFPPRRTWHGRGSALELGVFATRRMPIDGRAARSATRRASYTIHDAWNTSEGGHE